jgi:hypothetical protein
MPDVMSHMEAAAPRVLATTHVGGASAFVNNLRLISRPDLNPAARREPTWPVKLLKTQKLNLAERVGFEPDRSYWNL